MQKKSRKSQKLENLCPHRVCVRLRNQSRSTSNLAANPLSGLFTFPFLYTSSTVATGIDHPVGSLAYVLTVFLRRSAIVSSIATHIRVDTHAPRGTGMKIQLTIALTTLLITSPCFGDQVEFIPAGEASQDTATELTAIPAGHSIPGDGWVSRPVETVPYGFTTGEPVSGQGMFACPHCQNADCCKLVTIQKMVWVSRMYPIEVWNWQLEETGSKVVRKDHCDPNGVCTQIDQLIRQKELICHKSTIQVPGLVPRTKKVQVKMCFKCKRSH